MPSPRPSLLQSKWLLALSAVAVGAVASPLIGQAVRPALRKLVKIGIVAERRLGVVAAGLREDFEDVVAEAKAQVEAESTPASAQHAPASANPRPAENGVS